jgi:hypothetical protein
MHMEYSRQQVGRYMSTMPDCSMNFGSLFLTLRFLRMHTLHVSSLHHFFLSIFQCNYNKDYPKGEVAICDTGNPQCYKYFSFDKCERN